MREDPNIEFGRLDLDQDFGFGIDPTEEKMMNENLQNAFHGEGLFEELASGQEPGNLSIFSKQHTSDSCIVNCHPYV